MTTFRHEQCRIENCSRAAVNKSPYCAVHGALSSRVARGLKGIGRLFASTGAREGGVAKATAKTRASPGPEPSISHENLTDKLFDAVRFNKAERARELIDAGANLNALNHNGNSLLHVAILQRNKTICELLISSGIDVNLKSASGFTPLNAAYSEPSIAKLLESAGAYTASKLPPEPWEEATQELLKVARGNQVQLVSSLLAQGADVNAEDDAKWTPLHHAAYGGCVDIVEMLLAAGTDADRQDKAGRTPLQIAEGNLNSTAAEVLRPYTGNDGPTCDVCPRPMAWGTGYGLTTSEVVSTEAYWMHLLSYQAGYIHGRDPAGGALAELVKAQSTSVTAWLVCDECAELFEFDRNVARQFNSPGSAPPGSGPADTWDAALAAAFAWSQLYDSWPSSIRLREQAPPSDGSICDFCRRQVYEDEEMAYMNESALQAFERLGGLKRRGGPTRQIAGVTISRWLACPMCVQRARKVIGDDSDLSQ